MPEVLPKGVKLVGPAGPTEEVLPKGVRLVIEEEGPKNLQPNRPISQHEIAQRKEKARQQEAKYQQEREEEIKVAVQIKDFAGKKVQELRAAKPPPAWKKVTETNERGEEIEVMKRSLPSLQHDLAVQTYERIAEIDPEDMGNFIKGFQAGGYKGFDAEGTLRLLPFVGSFLDYNEADLLNKAANEGKSSPSAEELLLAKNLQLQMQALVNKGRWEEVGVLMSQMVPLAGEFLLTRGLGGEVSTATRGYAATLIKDVPKAAKVLKGFAAASRSGLGSSVIQTGVNIPRTAATAEARKTPEMGGVELDEKGNFVAKPLTAEAKAKVEGTWEATLKAFGSGVVENFSERFGGFADDLFVALRAKGLGISKEALEKTLKGVGENGLDALRKKFKSAGVDSFIGEVFLEEVPSQVLTSVVTGDELNLDFDQLLNLGISAGIPGGVVTATAVPRALGYMFGKLKPKPKPVEVAPAGKPTTQSDKYEVTGELDIKRVSTGPHEAEGANVIEYSTGLKNKRTGKPVVIHEISDGTSVMFQTPDGEFVGNSVQDVADQVQKAGLPQVTEAQVAQAEKVIGAGGYNKASFKKALTEVFNYPDKQAETVATIADKMIQTMAKRQGITPDQAYNQIKLAKGVINEAGEIVEEIPVKKAPSKADKALAGKLKVPIATIQEAEIDAATGKYKTPPLQESGGKALGAYQPLGGGRGLIYAFRHADVTTALHEMSHHYELNVLTAAEKAKIEEWSGAKAGTTEFSESFARGFETFLKKGEVKSPEMKAAFQKFRAYLSDVINRWIDSGRQLSAPMENIYRAMLGEEAVEELKEKANAIQERESAKVSVQPAAGDSKTVGEKVPDKKETATKGKEEKTEKVGSITGAALSKVEEIIDGGVEVLGDIMKKLDKASAEFKAYKDNFASKEEFIGFRRWLVDNKEKLDFRGSAVSFSSDLFIQDRAAFDKLFADYKNEPKAEPAKVEKKPEPVKEEKKEPEKKAEPGVRAEGSMKKFEHPEMENPVYSVVANEQEKFIQRIETNEGHRWVEVQKEGGIWATVKHDNLFENYLGDTSKEAIATLQRIGKPLTHPEAVEAVTGDASVAQPSMQPAKAETPDAYIETIKKQPKKVAPPPVKRTPSQQPTEDVESTAEAVVEALKGLDFVPDTIADITDFVASLDEDGRPLGPGRAFAIVQQMHVDGLIEISGKRVKPLFQKKPLFQQKNDYMTDAQKHVLESVAKAAVNYSPVANMQAQGFAAFRDWVKQVELGAKGDFDKTVKAIGSALNVTADEARNIYAGIKKTKAPKVGSKEIAGEAKAFFDAWTGGRGSVFTQYGTAWEHFVKQVKNAKLSETVNPLNWTRIVSLPVSALTSLVQSAKTLAFGNLEAQYITPRMRAFADWFADKMKAGVTHRNHFIRNITQAMQGFYRGLAYTSEGVEAQSRLRGGINEGHILAQKLMTEMYHLVGRDKVKIERVHAVLDPEAYIGTNLEGITAAALGADEALLYQTLKDNMELLHDHSFARGYISEETYLRHKNAGGYFGRAYQEILDGELYGKDVSDTFGSIRTDFSIYTRRKDFEEIGLTLERDPIFIAAQRMATAVANQAVTDYADYIADTANSKVITYSRYDFEGMAKKPRGFTLLRGFERGGGIYGFLTNRYVPNYIAYDFKGFFLTSKLGQTFYNGIKMYDRHWIRQEMKKTLTAYNPAVFIGNQSSNYTFAFLNDVDLFNFNIMLAEADKSIDEQDTVYNKLVAAGVIGADIHGAELSPLRIQEEEAKKAKDDPSLVNQGKGFLNKVVLAYSKTDDRAKIAAYRVKTEVQGKTSEQAITEIMTGFQNYQNVGMFYDIASKLPVFGNAFAKFLGDVRRIAVTSIAYRPLTTAAYLGTIYGLQSLASAGFDEDEESRAIRENRPYQPRIPFLGMPLTFKIGGKEINLARYIFPYTVYDKGDASDSMWNTMGELMPIQPYVTNGPGKPGYLKFDDPILGPWLSLLTDKDFRGMSVSNPTKTADSDQRMWNRAEYLFRSFGWLPTTATDMYHIALEGEDYYGRNRTKMDRIVSIFIRVEEFNEPEVRKTMTKQIRNLGYDVERVHDKMSKLVRDGKKNIIAIQNNTTLSEEQRARKLENEVTSIQKSLVEMADEYHKANKKLTDAASYNIEIAKKLNEKKVD